jgi:3-(3-hydroxy-phenyl)propionate hydroxylase
MRNHVLRVLTRLPGVSAGLVKLAWIPDARYGEGFFAAGHRAAGWQIPQPWVSDGAGATVRLDDLLDRQWAVVYTGAPPDGAHAWTQLGVRTLRVNEPALSRWLQGRKAAAVVLRPDGFIYAAAESGQLLPPPPAGYSLATKAGVSA